MKIILFATLLFFVCATPAQAQVVLSEVYPAPTSGENEWIELYNTSDVPVNISGWKLFDHFASTSELTTFTETQIEPYNFLVFELTTHKLNNSEEEITLQNQLEETVSSIHFSHSESQKSFSYLFIDNSTIGTSLQLTTPTKNDKNQLQSTPVPSNSPTPTTTTTNHTTNTSNQQSMAKNENALSTSAEMNAQENSEATNTTSQATNTTKMSTAAEQIALYRKIKAKLTTPHFVAIEKEGLEKRLPQLSYIVQKKVSKEGVISAIIGGSLLLFTGLLL